MKPTIRLHVLKHLTPEQAAEVQAIAEAVAVEFIRHIARSKSGADHGDGGEINMRAIRDLR